LIGGGEKSVGRILQADSPLTTGLKIKQKISLSRDAQRRGEGDVVEKEERHGAIGALHEKRPSFMSTP